jgi:endoglucanase
MRLVLVAVLTLVTLSAPGASFAQGTPTVGDEGAGEAAVPDTTARSAEVAKLLGVSLAGAEFGEQRLPGRVNFDYVYPTERQTYNYYSSKGFRIVRLPFLWERVQPRPFGPLAREELAAIRSVLDLAASANQQVILDLHNYGRYYNEPMRIADAGRLADVWVKLAHEFRGHPGIFGYELMNEPHDLPDGSSGWAQICQIVTDAVRTEDTTTFILIPGYSWQGAESWPRQNQTLDVRDGSGLLLYAAHQYFDGDNSGKYQRGFDGASLDVGAQRIRPFAEWLAARNARGILTEFGVPDDEPRGLTVLERFLLAVQADERLVGGVYWAGGPWWGSYPLSIEPRGGQDRPQISVLSAFAIP